MSVDFTFQTEGRYNERLDKIKAQSVDFTFQTEGRYNSKTK